MTDDSLLAQLAEDFILSIRSGKAPDPEMYVAGYPQLAGRIRELFPTLMMLESAAGTRGDTTPQEATLSPGSAFGRYRILREIGRGGMGIVYEAVQVAIEKRVALKILPLQAPVDAHQLERFFREARVTADLKHPNIVPMLEVGQVSDTAYFAMRYIEGRSLDRILRLMQLQTDSRDLPLFILDSRRYRISSHGVEAVGDAHSISSAARRIRAGVPARFDDYLKWVANIGIQAASGLAYAHEHRLIHRDIKPSNLLLDKNGILWIADFGLARRMQDPTLTSTGVLLGTPRYMSPEQAEAAKGRVDHRSDIYSLGATIYELLTCRPVFEGITPQEILLQILIREPVAPRRLNPLIPTNLETVVMKAMAKRPEHRYQSAKDLADDLRHWLKMEPVKAKRIGPFHRSFDWCQRNVRFTAVAASLILTLIILGGLYYRETVRERSGRLGKAEDARVNSKIPQKPAEVNQPSPFPASTFFKDSIPDSISLNDSVAASTLSEEAGSPTLSEIDRTEDKSRVAFESAQKISSGRIYGGNANRNPSPGKNNPMTSQGGAVPPVAQAVPGLAKTKTLRIRIGTIAPKDTLWHDVLRHIKQDWERISNGGVKVSIFPGGILGDGFETVDQVRRGRLQAAAVSSVELSRIDNSVNCLQIPMMFRSYEELDYVWERMRPRLEKKFEERGFKLLFWADAGWVYAFTKTPVRTPDELRKMRLITAAGDPERGKLYKELGFHVVPLTAADMIPSLQVDMVNAANLTPPYALATEAYRPVSNMIGIKWIPLIAGTVIDLKMWEGLPAQYRPLMLEAARKRGDEFQGKIRNWAEDSIKVMETRGLYVIRPDADTLALWQCEAENSYSKLRGSYVPAGLFDEVQSLRDEFRKYNAQEAKHQ